MEEIYIYFEIFIFNVGVGVFMKKRLLVSFRVSNFVFDDVKIK